MYVRIDDPRENYLSFFLYKRVANVRDAIRKFFSRDEKNNLNLSTIFPPGMHILQTRRALVLYLLPV